MSQYGQQYQVALADVLVKWEDEGADAARLYIHENITHARAVALAQERTR